MALPARCSFLFLFLIVPATAGIYTLSLHDALPISTSCSARSSRKHPRFSCTRRTRPRCCSLTSRDRKSTRLNSSHTVISYAVFCLKKQLNCGDLLEDRRHCRLALEPLAQSSRCFHH